MPFGYDKPHSWLRADDEFDRYNKPGAADWFSLSDEVSFKKPNNRHDAMKVESLLGYGGYLDLEKGGGPLGLSNRKLEEPIKTFQAKNGLKVDGLLKPGGPTIAKMKQLYGGVFGGTPAPTPAMMDAHVQRLHDGQEGFLHDQGPTFELRPNRRLDGKAHLMAYERWNRDWARNSGDNPKSLAPEYESYIRDIDENYGHDPGLIFARDLVRQVGKYHGPANGSELAKHLAVRLSDRPDLQQQLFGGPVPTSPPIGTFKPGGEDGVKQWIDQDRVANGLKPRYAIPAVAPAQDTPQLHRVSTRGLPAPEAINLFDFAQEMQGLPEDWSLQQQPPHAPDQPNPRPVDPPAPAKSEAKPEAAETPVAGDIDPNRMTPAPKPPPPARAETPAAAPSPSPGEGGAGWYDPNQMTPVPKHDPADAPPAPAPAPERRPHQAESDAVLGSMIRNAKASDAAAYKNLNEAITLYRLKQSEIERRKRIMLADAGKKSGEAASTEAAQHLAERAILQPPPWRGIGNVTTRNLFGAGAVGAIVGAAASISDGNSELRVLEADRDSLAEKIATYRQIREETSRQLEELRLEEERRRQGRR